MKSAADFYYELHLSGDKLEIIEAIRRRDLERRIAGLREAYEAMMDYYITADAQKALIKLITELEKELKI